MAFKKWFDFSLLRVQLICPLLPFGGSFRSWVLTREGSLLILLPWMGLLACVPCCLALWLGLWPLTPNPMPLPGHGASSQRLRTWHQPCPVSWNVLWAPLCTEHPFSFVLPASLLNLRVIIKRVYISPFSR